MKHLYLALLCAALLMLSACTSKTTQQPTTAVDTPNAMTSETNAVFPEEGTPFTLDDVSVTVDEASHRQSSYHRFTLSVGERKTTFEGTCDDYRTEDIQKFFCHISTDGIPDIAIAMITSRGTGICPMELHIFDGKTLEKLSFEQPWDIIANHVVFSGNDTTFFINIDGTVHEIDKARYADYGYLTDAPFAGKWESWSMENEHLVYRVNLQAGMSSIDGYLQILYEPSENTLLYEEIAYICEDFPK